MTVGANVEICNYFPYHGLTGRIIEVKRGWATVQIDFRTAYFVSLPTANLIAR
jgi:hypothetical protein